MPFAAYFDFETTTTACGGFNAEDNEMFLIYFVIIFAFHPKLDIDRIIIEWSFHHSLEKLTNISYLTAGMLKNYDPVPAEQLRDCAINVSQKKKKIANSEMCSMELKFASDYSKKCLTRKTKNVFSNLTQCQKNILKKKIEQTGLKENV